MSRRLPLLIALLTFAVAACTPQREPDPPVLPAFTGGLADSAEFYRLEFLSDGFPGKREGDRVIPQPIYGTYVLKDYVEQYRTAPSQELEDALRTVGHAAVQRMSDFKGSLVFWYEPDPDGAARLYRRHYSGLTQGYYALYLHEAGRITGDEQLVDAGRRAFKSLTIPASEGGVLFPGRLGPSIAEVPQEPNSLILNGWQSALASILTYAEVSGSTEARELAERSAAELARLLPLYDMPELKNTRYGLSGFQYLRLVFADPETPEHVRLSDIFVTVPGEGAQPVPKREASRWENQVLPADVTGETELRPKATTVRLSVVLSRASFPQPNVLSLAVASTRQQKVSVQVLEGRYDPLKSSAVDGMWRTVAEQVLDPGRRDINVPLPWEALDLVAYPTNFAKRIEGKQTNVYHVVHVRRLRELAARTGVEGLSAYADRWEDYICSWGGMPVYEGLHVRTLDGISPVNAVPGCDGSGKGALPEGELEEPGA